MDRGKPMGQSTGLKEGGETSIPGTRPLPAAVGVAAGESLACPFCGGRAGGARSEEHTSELQSQSNIVCRLLLEKKKTLECTLVSLAHLRIAHCEPQRLQVSVVFN